MQLTLRKPTRPEENTEIQWYPPRHITLRKNKSTRKHRTATSKKLQQKKSPTCQKASTFATSSTLQTCPKQKSIDVSFGPLLTVFAETPTSCNFEEAKITVNSTWDLDTMEGWLEGYHDKEIVKYLRYRWPLNATNTEINNEVPRNQKGAR